jgi:hypothetical protein
MVKRYDVVLDHKGISMVDFPLGKVVTYEDYKKDIRELVDALNGFMSCGMDCHECSDNGRCREQVGRELISKHTGKD